MIIRSVARIYPVEQLVTELQRLTASVARMRVKGPTQSGGISSAWFLTPDIVIVPGFNFHRLEFFDKIYVDGPAGWQTEVVEAPELLGFGILLQASKDVAALALLKLSQSMPSRVLPLCFDNPMKGAPVCLVHFPDGVPSPSVSFGQVTQAASELVEYDADTRPGSSGAPVLDISWRVLAMHVGNDAGRLVNQGLSRAAMLNVLRGSKWWAEIASHHRLADDAAAQVALQAPTSEVPSPTWPGQALIRAAISPRIDPAALSEDERATLSDLVVDDTAEQWVLRPGERRRVIAGAGSLDALNRVRSNSPAVASDDTLQRVIDDILSGPPYNTDDASDDTLSSWIQASRWFEPVASGLPTASDIANILARRRVRGKLHALAGPEFQGRKNELGRLNTWYGEGNGPFVLTGIGGIGKSALVARFASKLPPSTLLLWLDFDRPDIAPDNAASVLAAIAEQAAVQLDGFTRTDPGEDAWQDDAHAICKQLAALMKGRPPPLLVLESFEAAQYAERYQELWPVIEEMSRDLPDLRICVTGRAQVPALRLKGRMADSLNLTGLPKADAREWLRAKGFSEPRVIEAIVKIARGIPLVLKLAFRFVETGGAITDLPKSLPRRMIAGYLYDRILDRVQNPRFKPVVTGLLVLRRLTVDMIAPVLGGLVAFPEGEPEVWFAELSREMALVEGTSVLLPRREVRSATLWLLERDRRSFVRRIDKRAADWYRRKGAESPEEAAELVYHLLRTGNIDGAVIAWREDCAPFLTFAADDIRGAAARAWLKDRLGDTSEAVQSLATWEEDASKRIRAARSRKLDRVVSEILRERSERSGVSPLVFHDAFELRAAGRSAAAIDVLAAAGDATGPIGRDRIALRALLEWERGDRRAADTLLQSIQATEIWMDRTGGPMAWLAVLAARIGLTVDLEKEMALLGLPEEALGSLRKVLSPADVVSPRLRQTLRSTRTLEHTLREYDVDGAALDGPRLLDCIEQERMATVEEDEESYRLRDRRAALLREWSNTAVWTRAALTPADFGLSDGSDAVALELAEMGWRRWWLASTTSFVGSAYEMSMSQTSFAGPLYASIAGTLALFAMRMDTIQLNGRHQSLADAIQTLVVSSSPIRIPMEHWSRLKRLLRSCVGPGQNWQSFVRVDRDGKYVTVSGKDLAFRKISELTLEQADVGPFLLFLLSPNPLLQLAHDLAGSASKPRFGVIGVS